MMIRKRSMLALVVLATLLAAGPIRAKDDLSRPLRTSPDGHYLTQPDGEPFFWQGDTAWALITRLNREEADLYLRDRAAKGFNIIQAVAAAAPTERLETPNRYGQQPFVEGDPRRPNELYFQHLDWVIDRARSYGIRVALLPIWGVSQISMRHDVFDAASAEGYGRWLGSRYRDKGLVWVLGGDTSPIFAAGPQGVDSVTGRPVYRRPISVVDERPLYDAFARGIEAGAGADAFITFHPGSYHFSGTAPMRTSLYFHDRAWLDMNMLQSGHYVDARIPPEDNWIQAEGVWVGPRNYEIVAAEYASEPARPVIDGEARFEDLAIGVKKDASLGYWTGYDARNAAYHAVFAGGAGHTYGNYAVQQYQNASAKTSEALMPGLDWQHALTRPAAAQMQYLKKLMLSRPYFTRIPDPALIVGDPGQGTAHISATRDKDGRYAFIYLPHGQPVTVDMTRLVGTRFTAWWFDPRTGEAQRMPRAFRRGSGRRFVPPSNGPQVDWVLVLDSEESSFPAPGAAR